MQQTSCLFIFLYVINIRGTQEKQSDTNALNDIVEQKIKIDSFNLLIAIGTLGNFCEYFMKLLARSVSIYMY